MKYLKYLSVMLVSSYAAGIGAVWWLSKTAVEYHIIDDMPSWQRILLYASLVPAYIFMNYNNSYKPDQEMTPAKKAALYPEIPEEYLSDKPEGMIFARYKDKRTHKWLYLRLRVTRDTVVHGTIIGPPGSGKSSGPYLCTLIANFMRKKPPYAICCLDPKPELAAKSVQIKNNKRVRVVNIADRNSWGYDPYYELDGSQTIDEIWVVMRGISEALIISANPKDIFFVNSARDILQGLLIYYYLKDVPFVDAILKICKKDVKKLIQEVLKDEEISQKTDRVQSLLNSYAEKDSEAMQDIELTMTEHLKIFTESNVIWSLRDNPRKASPKDLDKGKSVFFSVPEKKLTHYKDILRLQIYQVLNQIKNRNEDKNYPLILMIIDEFAILGKIEGIDQSIATARSRGASIWLAYQDQSQIEATYGKEGARAITNPCEVKCILGCNDIDTAETFSKMAGTYRDIKRSVKHSGNNVGDETMSTEYRNVLEPHELIQLPKAGRGCDGEMVVFIKGKYMRATPIRYYNDPILKKQYAKIKQINEGGK